MAPKAVLITGCSEPDSVGAALARGFLAKGFTVFATARKVETMDALKQAGCEVLALDVTDKLSIDAAVASVREKAGRLDILINNAGLASVYPVIDTPLSAARQLFEVNVFALISVTQAFTPLLLEARTARGPNPVVLNVGSVAAWGLPWIGAYAASKAATHSLSDTMAREMKPLGIRVVIVHLGGVKTAMALGQKSVKAGEIPSSSPYFKSWTKINEINAAESAKQAQGSWTSEATAEKLIRKVLKTRQAHIWAGFGWQLFKYILPYFNFGLVDFIFSKLKHVDMARLPITEGKKED